MLVKELIEKLKELNPDDELFTHGYEGGYHDLTTVSHQLTMTLKVNTEPYYGPHEITSDIRSHNCKQAEGKPTAVDHIIS